MSQMPDTVMLFAAGFGTRMLPLTRARPKPLIEVAGEPLIDHALALIRAAGIRKVVCNLHYHADQLEAHLKGTGVITIREEPDILETGGGLKNALTRLGTGPVFVMNADAIWRGPNPLSLLARDWRAEQMEALQLLVPTHAAIGHSSSGDWDCDADGRLSRGSTFVYPGAHITRTDGLAEIAETAFSLNRLWDRMIARGGLYGTLYPGKWCDVGRPESIALAEALLDSPHV
jgi:MurNAc alpha-1-phosphate uridylyltransferase